MLLQKPIQVSDHLIFKKEHIAHSLSWDKYFKLLYQFDKSTPFLISGTQRKFIDEKEFMMMMMTIIKVLLPKLTSCHSKDQSSYI